MNEIEIFEVEDVAKMLKISKATVYKLLSNNQLKCVRVARKYLIPKNSIYEFIYGASSTDEKQF